LIEIARQEGKYIPDLSFRTHFFQDLVETSIRYIPLYPDDSEVIFNEAFLKNGDNLLSELLPQYASLSHVIHVIDVPKRTDGHVLRVLMNAEQDKALAMLSEAGTVEESVQSTKETQESKSDHWSWRLRMTKEIASHLDPDIFGVKGSYVFGSTKNATARPDSDIDIIVHFSGSEEQRKALTSWLEGWSLCLSEMNYLRCGAKTDGLLHVHWVTDEDIKQKNSIAVKIDAATDVATRLPLKSKTDN